MNVLLDIDQAVDELAEGFADRHRDIVPHIRLDFLDQLVNGREGCIWTLRHSRIEQVSFVSAFFYIFLLSLDLFYSFL